MGDDAQDVINRQLPACDLVVAILWNRLGTRTARADSGTAEELERALARWEEHGNPVLLYSKTAPFRAQTTEEAAQLGSVLAFRERLRDRGVFDREFETTEEFKDLVRPHLRREIRDWLGAHPLTDGEAPLAPAYLERDLRGGSDDVYYSVEVMIQDRNRRVLRLEGGGAVRKLEIRGSKWKVSKNVGPVAERD